METKLQPPAAPAPTQDSNGQTLVLILNSEELVPKDNMVGTMLLVEFLSAKIEAAGQLRKRSAFTGALDQCIITLPVVSIQSAKEIVCEALASVHLLPTAGLFYWDGREGIFRQLYHGTAKVISHDLMIEILQFIRSKNGFDSGPANPAA